MYHSDVAGAPADYTPESGALIVGRTAPAAVWTKEPPAAANGQVLTSDDTQATGVKWDGGPVPQHGIIVWPVAAGANPTGYVTCDGTNGTPNLPFPNSLARYIMKT